MTRFEFLTVGTMAVLTLLGFSGSPQLAAIDHIPAVESMTQIDVLPKAKLEIAKLGIKLPDQMMLKGLGELGFRAKVTAVGDGWNVAHPLGHPWAISWVHLEMDSCGKVLRHRFDPGE